MSQGINISWMDKWKAGGWKDGWTIKDWKYKSIDTWQINPHLEIICREWLKILKCQACMLKEIKIICDEIEHAENSNLKHALTHGIEVSKCKSCWLGGVWLLLLSI